MSILAPSHQENESVGNSKNMFALSSKAVAFVIIAFYFLFVEKQTEASRFQQLLLLQHLERSRRKRMFLFAPKKNIRCTRRAWSWLEERISSGLKAFKN